MSTKDGGIMILIRFEKKTNSLSKMKRHNVIKKHAGLTLVELLVTIAILAILAALTFVGIHEIKGRAQSAKSVSNLRQLGTALFAFAGDNNNRIPNIGSWSRPENPPADVEYPVSWDGYLFSYLGISERVGQASLGWEELFVHPADQRSNGTTAARRTYAMFRAVGSRQGDGWSGGEFTSLGKVNDAGGTGLLTERPWGGGYAGTPSFADISNVQQMAPNPETGKNLNPSGKFNILFVDGHLESLLPEETVGTGSVGNPLGLWTFTAGD
ncbi:MAG: type II secretion system protein [Verrucomicrobiales bacterium]